MQVIPPESYTIEAVKELLAAMQRFPNRQEMQATAICLLGNIATVTIPPRLMVKAGAVQCIVSAMAAGHAPPCALRTLSALGGHSRRLQHGRARRWWHAGHRASPDAH